MQTLQIINGHDEIIKTFTVGDNITQEQIAEKIKFLLGNLACFATYTLGNKKIEEVKRIENKSIKKYELDIWFKYLKMLKNGEYLEDEDIKEIIRLNNLVLDLTTEAVNQTKNMYKLIKESEVKKS
jgi:hypothetical protein